MAGFAIVMTLLTWGFFLLVIAVILAVVLYRFAKQSSPGPSFSSRRYRIFNAGAPFLGLVWIIFALILHTAISNRLAHQSVGYSPDPYVTLPNGYVVGSANTYDGYVHAPGMPTDIPWTGPGYVRGVIDLSYSDGRFTGTYLDSRSGFQPQGTDKIRSFVLDTRDRSIRTFDSQETASFEQQQDKVHEDENSYWKLYARYRRRWPTAVFWLFLIAGEASIVMLVRRLKPSSDNDMQSA